MSDSDSVEPQSHRDPQLGRLLRFTAFALPSFVAMFVLLFCWRTHFSIESILGSALLILLTARFTTFFWRRSRGLSTQIFFQTDTSPDDDLGSQDQVDFGGLLGSVIFVGTLVYILIRRW